VNLGSTVNSGNWDGECGISWDGLALFYGTGRTGIVGAVDIWMSTRKTLADPWTVGINLSAVVNSSSNDGTARISPDMRTLYFCSDRPGSLGGYDLFEAPIIPLVDFNGDRIVDSADMCVMVEHWHTDYPPCDIGPAPWGDGIVDVEDLKVLAEHLFDDYRLAAHWKLDETDGDIAHDSIAGNNGTCHGGPVWGPDIGEAGGALVLDGTDDYVGTPFILDPAKGAFSAFVWIYGGGPRQEILSQTDVPGNRGVVPGSTWLGISAADGKLATGLFGGLESDTVITDLQWHHVGLVYNLDSLNRRLYVDGVLTAEDATVVSGVPSDGGLHIGAGRNLDPDSFFLGMIDDVRIYNVALTPDQVEALTN